MPDPVDIAAFILACVGEEEADANAAIPVCGANWSPRSVIGDNGVDAEAADHIARQNPAVTLAKAEMVRGVIADYEKTERLKEENAAKFSRAMREDPPDQGKIAQLKTHGWELAGRKQAMRAVVFRIALAYRLRPDGTVHPKWRKEWEA